MSSFCSRLASNDGSKKNFMWLDKNGTVEREWSIQDIYRRSAYVSHILTTKYKLHKGDRVTIAYPFGLDFLVGFVGCLRAGIIVCSVYPPDPTKIKESMDKFNKFADDAGTTIVLTTSAYKKMLLGMRLVGKIPNFKKELTWVPTDVSSYSKYIF